MLSDQDLEAVGILDVFQGIQTDEMKQKIRQQPQTVLLDAAKVRERLGAESV